MAAKFWVGGGTNTNFNSSPVTNWANTSGGAGNQAVPGVTDDVTFDGVGASANGPSVISATISFLSLTITSGYTNTMTHNAVLTVAGNVTFSTAYTIAGTSGLTISAASTIDSNTKVWPNNVTFTGTNTKTLAENWSITGSLSVSGSATVINGNTLNIAGGLVAANTFSGTTLINLTGGTWSGSSVVSNSITIAGNVTISGTVGFAAGTLTYSSGTITTTSSTLSVLATATFNTNGITWNSINLGGTSTITINSLLTATGTMNVAAASILTFAGTAGWTVGTLTLSHTAAATQTLVNNVTYTITTAFNCFLSRVGSIVLFTSDHASNKAILTLNNGATCNVLASFTRIDASNGRAIWTFNGVVTTCFNIFSLTDLSFVVARSQVIQGFSNY